MSHYKSNIRDIEFNLFEVLGRDEVLGQGPFEEIDPDTARAILGEVDRLAREDMAASYEDSDRNPPVFDPKNGTADIPESFKKSYQAWMDAEYWRLSINEDLGGTPAPATLNWAIGELVLGSNPAVHMYSSGFAFSHSVRHDSFSSAYVGACDGSPPPVAMTTRDSRASTASSTPSDGVRPPTSSACSPRSSGDPAGQSAPASHRPARSTSRRPGREPPGASTPSRSASTRWRPSCASRSGWTRAGGSRTSAAGRTLSATTPPPNGSPPGVPNSSSYTFRQIWLRSNSARRMALASSRPPLPCRRKQRAVMTRRVPMMRVRLSFSSCSFSFRCYATSLRQSLVDP